MKKSTNEKVAKLLEKIAINNGIRETESACEYIYHQPKAPDSLKRLQK